MTDEFFMINFAQLHLKKSDLYTLEIDDYHALKTRSPDSWLELFSTLTQLQKTWAMRTEVWNSTEVESHDVCEEEEA